MIMKNGNILE